MNNFLGVERTHQKKKAVVLKKSVGTSPKAKVNLLGGKGKRKWTKQGALGS